MTKRTRDEQDQTNYINNSPPSKLSPDVIGDGVSTSVPEPEDRGRNLQITSINNPRFIYNESPTETSSPVDSRSGVPSNSINIDRAVTANQTSIQQNTSVREIAEAYVVDEEVFVATPTKPFWKQLRVLILLALVITAVI